MKYKIKNFNCGRSDGISMHYEAWHINRLRGSATCWLQCYDQMHFNCSVVLVYLALSKVERITNFRFCTASACANDQNECKTLHVSWHHEWKWRNANHACRQKRSWSKKESKLCRMPCCDSVEYGGAFYTPSQLQLSSFILINREGKLHTGVTGNK